MADKRKITGYLAADPRRVEHNGTQFAAFEVLENKRYFDGDEQVWKDAKPTKYEVTVDQEGLRENLLASLESQQQDLRQRRIGIVYAQFSRTRRCSTGTRGRRRIRSRA